MASRNWPIDFPKEKGVRHRLLRSIGKRLGLRNFFVEYERRGERVRQLENTKNHLVEPTFQNSLLRLSSYPEAVCHTMRVEGAPYAFNPSLANVEGRFLSLVRDTNSVVVSDGRGYFYTSYPHRTENYVLELNRDLSLKECRKFDLASHAPPGNEAANGLEDIRLFTINSKLHAIGVGIKDAGTTPGGQREITQILLSLDAAGNVLNTMPLRSPFGYTVEKNWMPFEHKSELHIVYSVDPLVIFKIKNDMFVPLPGKATSNHVSNHNMKYSGSTNGISFKNGYLFIIHDRRRYGEKMSYIHYFMYLDSDLNMIEISEPFIFERSGIEFAINLVLDDDAILISYGVADRRARVLRIPAERVADLIAVS